MVYSEARRLPFLSFGQRTTMLYALERESNLGSTFAVLIELSEGRDVSSGPVSRVWDLASNSLPLDQPLQRDGTRRTSGSEPPEYVAKVIEPALLSAKAQGKTGERTWTVGSAAAIHSLICARARVVPIRHLRDTTVPATILYLLLGHDSGRSIASYCRSKWCSVPYTFRRLANCV
jgi:hypothetical protein